MTNKPTHATRRRGRRTKAEELAKAVAEFGIDPDQIDPRRVLASIAADVSAPATARVAAAKALAVLAGGLPVTPAKTSKKSKSRQSPESPPDDDSAEVVDLATRRALEIMKRKTP